MGVCQPDKGSGEVGVGGKVHFRERQDVSRHVEDEHHEHTGEEQGGGFG